MRTRGGGPGLLPGAEAWEKTSRATPNFETTIRQVQITKFHPERGRATALVTLDETADSAAQLEPDGENAMQEAATLSALQPFQVICTLRERTSLPARVLDGLPQLKAIVVTDARVSTIDYAAAAAPS